MTSFSFFFLFQIQRMFTYVCGCGSSIINMNLGFQGLWVLLLLEGAFPPSVNVSWVARCFYGRNAFCGGFGQQWGKWLCRNVTLGIMKQRMGLQGPLLLWTQGLLSLWGHLSGAPCSALIAVDEADRMVWAKVLKPFSLDHLCWTSWSICYRPHFWPLPRPHDTKGGAWESPFQRVFFNTQILGTTGLWVHLVEKNYCFVFIILTPTVCS